MSRPIVYRDNEDEVTFNHLEYECFVADLIDFVAPRTMEELQFIIRKMVEHTQTVAWEYVHYTMIPDGMIDEDEDWEDVAEIY